MVLNPNLPDRGVATDLSWLSGTVPAAQLQEMQAASTNRPAVQQVYGIQARNLARMHAAGVRVVLGTDGAATWAPLAELEDMVAAGIDGPARTIDPGLRLDLERAVASLPEVLRHVFVLHDIEGFQHDEIAAALGIPVGTCRSHLFRARRLLREVLS